MNNNQRKLLQLVDSGILKAEEAFQLFKSIEKKQKEKQLVIEIKSSFQETPFLKINLPVKGATGLKHLFKALEKSEFSMIFKKGKFNLDFSKLNWDQILELTLNPETGSIYYFETEGSAEESISFEIRLE